MKFQLTYLLKVRDSKYREFLNVLEKSLSNQKPARCSNRVAFQSINDMHVFEYREIWKDKTSLEEHMNSNEFKSLRGAFQLLTFVENFSVESMKLENTTSIQTAK